MNQAFRIPRSILLAVAVWLATTVPGRGQSPEQQAAPPDAPPPVPKGVEVMARGPVHEAFATPTGDPVPTKPIAKQPPQALEEMPPQEKPEGSL